MWWNARINGLVRIHLALQPETIHIGSDQNHIDARFPVQTVIRPHSDEYLTTGAMPAEWPEVFSALEMKHRSAFRPNQIRSVDTLTVLLNRHFHLCRCLTLEDDIDVSRGDMIVARTPTTTHRIWR